MRQSPQVDSQSNESNVVELTPPVTKTTNTLDTTASDDPAVVEQQVNKKKPVATPRANHTIAKVCSNKSGNGHVEC